MIFCAFRAAKLPLYFAHLLQDWPAIDECFQNSLYSFQAKKIRI
jgi:hypothetical protein